MSKIAKGRRVASGITSDLSRAEKIINVKETIKCNEYFIRYYTLLADNDPENHLSFESYKAILDKRKAELDVDYADLEKAYQHSTNGEIPALIQRNVELEQKLKTLRSELSPEQRKKKIERVKVKAKGLMDKIAQLEQELRDENFDFDTEDLE